MKLIPNLLSAARLALAPYLFVVIWRREYALALGLCLIAGITDGLDGLIARQFQAASRLGAYLDPIADKVLLSGAFLTLALDGAIDKWVAVLVLGRDVLILFLAGGAFVLTTVRSFPPSIWGKGSTVAQILFVLVLLAHFSGFASASWVEILKWLVVALTAWSGAHYCWIAFSTARRAQTLAANERE